MDPTSAALKEHAFQHLFIEVFGWDRTRITTKIDVGNAQYALNAVAQKRGFLVFVGQTHRTVLADRQRLRRIQTKLRRGFHEHILILYSEVPRKQVWQWVAGMGNGSRLVHREHPFFSDDPPEQLLERLTQLAVPFDAEGQTTLLDIAAKGRHALFPADERNLFVRKPIYANESDRLALAVKNNEPGALPRFVKYHLGLAKYGVKRLTCWFEMEEDDARQIAVIGLIHAARRFDPGRGIQFSRYAYSRICKTCQILGVSHESRVRIPPGVFWDCYRLAFDEERVLAEFGPQDLEERLAPFFENAGVSPWQWRAYCNNKTWQRLSDVKPRVVASTRITCPTLVLDEVSDTEQRDFVRALLVHLPQRQANVLRWRCGFESPPETLGEIAAKIGVTRERVRQIEKQATKALLRQVAIERAKRAARHAAVQTPSPIEMALPMAFINRETFHSIPIRRIHDPVTESRLRGAETPISSAEEIEECRHRYVTVGIENSQVGKSLPHGFVFRGRGIRHVLSWTRLWTLLIHHIFIHDRDLILRQMQLGPRRSKIAQLFTRYRWEAGMRAHVLAKQVNVHPGVSSIRQRELVRLLIAAGRFPPDDLMIILRKVRESTDSNCEPEGGDRS